MQTPIAKAAAVLVTLAIAVAIAGCGSDSSSPSTPSQPSPDAGASPSPEGGGSQSAAALDSGDDKAKSAAEPKSDSSGEKKKPAAHAVEPAPGPDGVSLPADSPTVRAALKSLTDGKHRKHRGPDPVESAVEDVISPEKTDSGPETGSDSSTARSAADILKALQE